MAIAFTKPTQTGEELDLLAQALKSGHLTEGDFVKKSENIMREKTGGLAALAMPSCTAALEAAIILADIKTGDEVIVPSFTFTSTATAIVMRGGVPVFVDCKPETMNVCPNAIAAAITPLTKAVMVMHYGGVACDMDVIVDLCQKHDLFLIEDAAQAIDCYYQGKPLGSFGDCAAFSFHQTKNINCGEGGMLVINNPDIIKRAEIIRDKGTNRAEFFRGEINKYSWQDLGSSFVMSELQGAMLYTQLKNSEAINARRVQKWMRYDTALRDIFARNNVKTLVSDNHKKHNGHLYFMVFETPEKAGDFKRHMNDHDVAVSYHYVPLHASPAGRKFGREGGDLSTTLKTDGCLLRLPLFDALNDADQDFIIQIVTDYFQ